MVKNFTAEEMLSNLMAQKVSAQQYRPQPVAGTPTSRPQHQHHHQHTPSIIAGNIKNVPLKRPAPHHTQTTNALMKHRTGFEGPLQPPSRKRLSLVKQPVTLVTSTTPKGTREKQNDDREKAERQQQYEGRQLAQQPRQLFWTKRLENLRAMVPVGRIGDNCEYKAQPETDFEQRALAETLALPNRIQAMNSLISDNAATISLLSSLEEQQNEASEQDHPPVLGQSLSRKNLDINPAAYTIAEQPLIQACVVGEPDINAQEQRVLDARRRLQEARVHFG